MLLLCVPQIYFLTSLINKRNYYKTAKIIKISLRYHDKFYKN
jgi:hypothetical protein